MLRGVRSRLSYANVVATMALFIALGGVSYAAVKLPANSVGTKQLKAGAVTGAKVKDRSLSAADFTGSVQGPAGPAGPPGPAGKDATAAALADGSITAAKLAAGAVGAGKLGVITVRTGATTNLTTADRGGSAEVSCEAGERLISGGVDGPIPEGTFSIVGSWPLATDGVATGWKARAYYTGPGNEGFAAYALCLAG